MDDVKRFYTHKTPISTQNSWIDDEEDDKIKFFRLNSISFVLLNVDPTEEAECGIIKNSSL